MVVEIIYLVIGLAGLYYGAEFLVKGGSVLAVRFGISPLVVGLTVVAFATSSPEVFASVKAAIRGSSDLALGNVVGSNLCNIGLILGAAALLKPIQVQAQLIKQEVPILLVSSLIFMGMLLDDRISRLDALFLFLGILAYVTYSIYQAKKGSSETLKESFTAQYEKQKKLKGSLLRDLFFITSGLIILSIGAKLLVDGATSFANAMGVSEALIGLTIVAIGTSLPELATTIIAAKNNEGDLAVGNAIGSCIFNNLAVLGITGLVIPLDRGNLAWMDMFAMLGFILVCFPLMLTGYLLKRWEGALYLVLYFGYFSYTTYTQVNS
ncbi:MAG: calcium/sodium antiporter [Verrucomicrobiota bacterium]